MRTSAHVRHSGEWFLDALREMEKEANRPNPEELESAILHLQEGGRLAARIAARRRLDTSKSCAILAQLLDQSRLEPMFWARIDPQEILESREANAREYSLLLARLCFYFEQEARRCREVSVEAGDWVRWLRVSVIQCQVAMHLAILKLVPRLYRLGFDVNVGMRLERIHSLFQPRLEH